MFVTNVLLKKIKAKYVMVSLQSTASSHKVVSFRERIGDKKQLILFDPFVEMECVYKEVQKIRSMKWPLKLTKTYNEDTYGIIPKELLELESKSTAPNKEKSSNK